MSQIKKVRVRPLYSTLRGLMDREMPSGVAFTLVQILRYLEGLSNEIEEEVHKLALELGKPTEVPGEILFEDGEARKAFEDKKKEISEEPVELECPKISVDDLKDVRLTPSEAMALEVLL